MGRPSYAIASTSRITQNDLVSYIFAMIKEGNYTATYLMEPNAIRHWLDKVKPFNAKIIATGKNSTKIVSGEIFSTPPEIRASEIITASTAEEILESSIKLRIKLLKGFKARKIITCAAENIHVPNGDADYVYCPNGTIPLDVNKSEDSVAIAWAEREKYLSTVSDLSDKDREVRYNEVTRNVNTKGAQVANLLAAFSSGKMTADAFKAACNKLDNTSESSKTKAKKQGTISCIGTWGR